MILQDGNFNGKQVLSKESIFKMEQDYTKNARVSYSPEQAGKMGYGLGEWIMENNKLRADVITSPGLFGSFPWVDNKRHYAGFLFVVNLKQKDREKNYTDLKEIIDNEIDGL